MATTSSGSPTLRGARESVFLCFAGLRRAVQPDRFGHVVGDAGDSGQCIGDWRFPCDLDGLCLPASRGRVDTDSSASARPRWRRSRSSDVYGSLFAIPFCITAVVDGGPATLMTLVIVAAVIQLIISKWLFILRRIVTPTVGGTIMMILSITLASVVFIWTKRRRLIRKRRL